MSLPAATTTVLRRHRGPGRGVRATAGVAALLTGLVTASAASPATAAAPPGRPVVPAPSHVVPAPTRVVDGGLDGRRAATLTGSLTFIRNHNVWVARPDGSGARAITWDGTARWPYASPSEDDRGHVVAIAGGPARDAKFVRLDQQGAVLQRFAPPIGSAAIIFAQVSPDGGTIAYGALFGSSDCADFGDCYTFFDHSVHYSRATRGVEPSGSGSASDVSWATWAGSHRTILEASSPYDVLYQSPAESTSHEWWHSCENYETGCNDLDVRQYEPTVDRAGDRVATAVVVQPWSSAIPATAYLQVLPTSGAVTGTPAAPGTGCAFSAPAPTVFDPLPEELTVGQPSFSPDGREVAVTWRDGATPIVAVAVLPDLGSCDTAAVYKVLDNASQPMWSPAALSPAALRYARSAPRVLGTRKVGKRLHLSLSTAALRSAFRPAATTLTYRWLRNGRPIAHATKAGYVVHRSDRGRRISVQVTGARHGYRSAAVRTPAVRIR